MATAFEVWEDGFLKRITYTALGNENGLPFSATKYADKTISATGTGTVTLEGSSDDGATWEPLKKTDGTTVISLNAANSEQAVVLENPPLMRAVNTAASARVVISCTK